MTKATKFVIGSVFWIVVAVSLLCVSCASSPYSEDWEPTISVHAMRDYTCFVLHPNRYYSTPPSLSCVQTIPKFHLKPDAVEKP